MSEFLRISRCTLRYEDFLKSAITLFNRMVNQGGSKIQVLKQISKGVMRHPIPFKKVQQKCKANKGGYFERKRLNCWWQTLPNKAGVVGYHQGSQKSNKNKKGCHMIIQYRASDDCSWCSGGDAKRR